MNQFAQVDPRDNVAIALFNIAAKTNILIGGRKVLIRENIKTKQKFAVQNFKKGEEVLMYGLLIGRAAKTIFEGQAITVENLQPLSNQDVDSSCDWECPLPDISKFNGRTFEGYHRPDGKVGTSNIWLLIPLGFVNCRFTDAIERAFSSALGYHYECDFTIDADTLIEKLKNGASDHEVFNCQVCAENKKTPENPVFENIDGIKVLKYDRCYGIHKQEDLCRLLAGYINHPNTAGATILNLGDQIDETHFLRREIEKKDPDFSKLVYFIEQTRNENVNVLIEEAVKKTFIGLRKANKIERKPAPISKLTLGLACGGSDGFSGISANPVLGYVSDLLIALGGTSVLSEFPELLSVKKEIVSRCKTQSTARRFLKLMKTNFEKNEIANSGEELYFLNEQRRYDLVNMAMLAAGALKKAGAAEVVDVLDYGESISLSGLNLLCTSDNEVESTTGLAGSGCNMIVFTTGVGSMTGNPLTPVLKMSSNTNLYKQVNNLIDIDAGTIILGKDTIQSKGEELLNLLIDVASGYTKCKADKYGQDGFIPWKRGN